MRFPFLNDMSSNSVNHSNVFRFLNTETSTCLLDVRYVSKNCRKQTCDIQNRLISSCAVTRLILFSRWCKNVKYASRYSILICLPFIFVLCTLTTCVSVRSFWNGDISLLRAFVMNSTLKRYLASSKQLEFISCSFLRYWSTVLRRVSYC
jgi:hypothetical protein